MEANEQVTKHTLTSSQSRTDRIIALVGQLLARKYPYDEAVEVAVKMLDKIEQSEGQGKF